MHAKLTYDSIRSYRQGAHIQPFATALILNRWGSAETAPTARLLQDLKADLGRRGISCLVVTCEPQPSKAGVSRLAAPTAASRLIALASMTMRAARLPRPDVVIALTDPPFLGVAARLLAEHWQVPSIHWCHDIYPTVLRGAASGLSYRVGQLLEGLAAPLHQGHALTVVPDSTMAETLQRFGLRRETIQTIPNWSEAPLRKSPFSPLKAGPLHLLYSGNYGRAHDLRPLFGTVSLLRQQGHSIRLSLTIRDHHMARAAAEMAAAGLPRDWLNPLVPAERLLPHLQHAHAHVVSIRPGCEGTVSPCKAEAAFAVGRPVLYLGALKSDVAGLIRTHGAGFVIDVTSGQYQPALRDLLSGWSAAPADRLTTMAEHSYRAGRRHMVEPCGLLGEAVANVVTRARSDGQERMPASTPAYPAYPPPSYPPHIPADVSITQARANG